jgi:hypothetical protein
MVLPKFKTQISVEEYLDGEKSSRLNTNMFTARFMRWLAQLIITIGLRAKYILC